MSTPVSLAPAIYAVDVVRGDALDVTWPVQTTAGEGADLSGYDVDADAVGVFFGGRTAFTAAISGSNVRLTLTPAQTAALEELSQFDVRFTATSGGAVATPITGTLTVLVSHTDLS